MTPYPHVTIDPEILGGSPHLTRSHVPVRRLWAWYRSGLPIATILRRYPALGPAAVLSGLAFAFDHRELVDADLEAERRLESERHATVFLVPGEG